MPENLQDARAVRDRAERIYTAAEVEAALQSMAARITVAVGGENPLVLCVLNGGIIPTGKLLPRLEFPLQLDSVHVSRYRGRTRGEELVWYSRPRIALRARTVLVIDDILDEGHTLAAVLEECRAAGARRVLSVVLVDKQHARKVPGLHCDIVGLQAPDRYLFGSGMDYRNYLRNVPGIYAVHDG